MSKPRVSHYKIVVAGYIVEAFQYAKPVGYQLLSSKKQSPYRKRRSLNEQEITISSLSRTRNTLIRLINANSRMWEKNDQKIEPLFITFTFKENIKNVSQANPLFTNFIKRLNYHIFNTKDSVVKYVVVPEFQKRGAVHYHAVFFNLPPIDIKQERETRAFQKLWEHGFIEIKAMNDVPNIGLYMTKYMTKNATDRRLVGRKKYFSSRELIKPDVVSYEHTAGLMMDFLSDISPIHAYITTKKPEAIYPPENPTFCATYNLSPEQLQDLKSFYTVNI